MRLRVLSGSVAAQSATTPTGLIRTLERSRDELLDRSVIEIVETIGRVANRFLDSKSSVRQLALQGLPDESGLSAPMAAAVLDGMAREWTTRSLFKLLHTEFEEATVLDTFIRRRNGGRHRAFGLSPAIHITSGNVPGVGTTSLIRGLMVKSATLLKPGSDDRLLSTLFLDALASEDPQLAAAAAVVEWDPEDEEVQAGIAEADLLVVYGGDEVIRWARSHAAANAQTVLYPHRVSAAVVMAGFKDKALMEAAAAVAQSVAMFDQRGCVSPHTVYVVTGDTSVAAQFAETVGQQLDTLGRSLPPGVPQAGEASAFQQTAGTIELEAAASVVEQGDDSENPGSAPEGQGLGPIVHGIGERWRVVYEPRPGFRGSPLGRFVWVRPVASVDTMIDELEPHRRQIQTLGVWGKVGAPALERLSRLGIRRITTIQRAPWPAARSRHDGTAPLLSLLRWVEVDG